MSATGAFTERFVEADGFRIRYCEAGDGDALVYLHGASGLRLSRCHDLLAERRRVVAVELPGFGNSPVNDRTASLDAFAATVADAVAALGIGRAALMGYSFGAKLALAMALGRPDVIEAVALLAPAAIRVGGIDPAGATPEELAALLHAHPERHAMAPPPPDVAARQWTLVRRLIGPPRDAEFEARLAGLAVPVLALFGTADRVIPAEAARYYRALLPDCHTIMVYDAAHAVHEDRPEAVASVVADFLERREGFLVNRNSALINP